MDRIWSLLRLRPCRFFALLKYLNCQSLDRAGFPAFKNHLASRELTVKDTTDLRSFHGVVNLGCHGGWHWRLLLRLTWLLLLFWSVGQQHWRFLKIFDYNPLPYCNSFILFRWPWKLNPINNTGVKTFSTVSKFSRGLSLLILSASLYSAAEFTLTQNDL